MGESRELKKITNMYKVARQFKNAIPEPKSGVMVDFEFMKRVFPYVVNKSFACEVYLKLILILDDKKIDKNHSIRSLYDKSGINCEFEAYIMANSEMKDRATIDDCINSFSNAFVEWRYIYEKDATEKLMYVFLSIFCDYLDKICKRKLLDKYDYDVDKKIIFF